VGSGAAIHYSLLTIVERLKKFALSTQVNSKKPADVPKTTIAVLKPFKCITHTITADNEKELTYHEEIGQALLVDVYYFHPYSPWTRELKENTNGWLRSYFPKVKLEISDATKGKKNGEVY
jgi:IS30 family transposase